MYDNLKVWVLPILKKLIVTASGRSYNDILKIYFQKDKVSFSPRVLSLNIRVSVKTVVADGVGQGHK